MNNLKEAFSKLEQHSLPPATHAKIMRRVSFIKLRAPFIIMILLLVVNLLVSGWRAWTLLSEREVFSIIKALLDSFEVSESFFNEFISEVSAVLPFASLVSFFTSLVLISYLVYLWNKLVQFQRSNHLINQ